VLLAWSLYPAIRLEYVASRQKAGLESKRDSLAEGNAKLIEQVADLKTPEGVERAARESLGYAKSGENVYVVVPPTSGETGAEDLTVGRADAAGRSVVQVLLDAIFGVEEPSTAVEP
jgi:hypothetical protein